MMELIGPSRETLRKGARAGGVQHHATVSHVRFANKQGLGRDVNACAGRAADDLDEFCAGTRDLCHHPGCNLREIADEEGERGGRVRG